MDSPLRPAIQSLGIIPFKSASVLVQEEQERDRASVATPAPFISSLAAHIDKSWSDAKTAKLPVETVMLENLRQRNGTYEADKLLAIKKMGGSEVYVLLTGTKCRAAEAWINDVLRPVSEQPWTITPTPIPELPQAEESKIKSEVIAISQEVVKQANAAGQQVRDLDLFKQLREYAKTRMEEVRSEIVDEAERRAERMALKIADQLAEGGWHDAFWAVVSDFVSLQAGVLKGPVVRKRKVQKWVEDPETGKWVIQTVDALVPEFYRVSPFDLYPAPDSRGPDDGSLIERHKLSRSELQAMIGVPGYSEENIRKALQDYGDGHISREPVDSSRAEIDFHGQTEAEQKGEKIEALEFWGSAQGKMLTEWGIPDLDPDLDYEISAWKVGEHVIRAILNPDKLGRKPYSVDSYERLPGSFWGKGIPQLMGDIQDICNAVARAVVNNSALASGPQVEVNVERLDSDSEELWPWKIWQSTNQQMSEAPAVRFFQPQIVTTALMQVFEFFSAMAEDQTGVPRWAHGNTDIGGAGETSSGLSMLMGHAARGIKESISHLDAMISDAIERIYDYNMAYDEDESIKGDCRIVARGSSSLIAKEQQVVRTREFLAATNNPTDIQILGLQGRANLLKEAAKLMDLDVDDIIPDESAIKKLVAKIEAERQAMMKMQMQEQGAKGSVPGKKPQTLDPAGNPAGGVEANLHPNPPGQTPGLT